MSFQSNERLSANDTSFFSYNYPHIDDYVGDPKVWREHATLFYNHGVHEAVNIDFDKKSKSFTHTSKKHGLISQKYPAASINSDELLLSQESCENQDYRILRENGKLYPILAGQGSCQYSGHNKTVDMAEVHYNRLNKAREPMLDVSGALLNMKWDHPDVSHGTYLRMFANMVPMQFPNLRYTQPFEPNSKLKMELNHKLPYKFLSSYGRFCDHDMHRFDSTILDVPDQLVHDNLTGEMINNFNDLYKGSQYYGGSLSYIASPSSRGDGFLIYPSGVESNYLMIRKASHHSHLSVAGGNGRPVLAAQAESFELSGEIRQSEATRVRGSDKLMVGARCDHSLSLFTTSNDHAPCHVDTMRFRQVVTCMSLSPHLADCLSVTRDHVIRLWDVNSQSRVSVLADEQERSGRGATRAHFGVHPRQVKVWDDKSLSLVDVRGKNMKNQRVVFECSDEHGGEEIASCVSGHEIEGWREASGLLNYEDLIMTDRHLYLIDQRYPKFHLLKWTASTSHPCQHLCATACRRRSRGEGEMVDVVVMGCNEHAHEMDVYHFGWRQDGSSSRKMPPSALTPPRRLDSFGTMLERYEDVEGRLAIRGRERITGVCAYRALDDSINLMHVNATGDVFAQNMRFASEFDDDDDDAADVAHRPSVADQKLVEAMRERTEPHRAEPCHHALSCSDLMRQVKLDDDEVSDEEDEEAYRNIEPPDIFDPSHALSGDGSKLSELLMRTWRTDYQSYERLLEDREEAENRAMNETNFDLKDQPLDDSPSTSLVEFKTPNKNQPASTNLPQLLPPPTYAMPAICDSPSALTTSQIDNFGGDILDDDSIMSSSQKRKKKVKKTPAKKTKAGGF